MPGDKRKKSNSLHFSSCFPERGSQETLQCMLQLDGLRRSQEFQNILEFSWLNQKSCYNCKFSGGVPEWLKGADCKSVGLRLHWFESSPLHQIMRAEVLVGVRR